MLGPRDGHVLIAIKVERVADAAKLSLGIERFGALLRDRRVLVYDGRVCLLQENGEANTHEELSENRWLASAEISKKRNAHQCI